MYAAEFSALLFLSQFLFLFLSGLLFLSRNTGSIFFFFALKKYAQ